MAGHGELSRYVAGCRCSGCRKANADWNAKRDRAIAYGRWKPFTDATPVREHLRRLAAAGIGFRRAAELAGVSPSTTQRIYRQETGKVRPETAAAILKVRPALAPGAFTDATGTRRRLQALAAAGWPLSRVGERLGWDREQVSAVMRQRKVTAATAEKVREVYDVLWDKPYRPVTWQERAAATQSAAYARRMGWPAPAAWDDDEIDDPRARPKGLRRRRLTVAETAAEARELLGMGLRLAEVVERLGVAERTVTRALAAYPAMQAGEAA